MITTSSLSLVAPILEGIIAVAVYTLVGLLLFGISYLVINRVLPFSLQKELVEEHNTAIAIVMAALIIAIAMIVVAAITG